MASRRRLRRKACDGKRRYASQTEAVAEMIAFKRAHPDDRVRSYLCRFCGGWHFGHCFSRPIEKPG